MAWGVSSEALFLAAINILSILVVAGLTYRLGRQRSRREREYDLKADTYTRTSSLLVQVAMRVSVLNEMLSLEIIPGPVEWQKVLRVSNAAELVIPPDRYRDVVIELAKIGHARERERHQLTLIDYFRNATSGSTATAAEQLSHLRVTVLIRPL